MIQLSFSRVEPAPRSMKWTHRQARALARRERRFRRLARRKAKHRPLEVQTRIRVGRHEQSRAMIERREELAVGAFEESGYRLRSRVIGGAGGITVLPTAVISQRPAIILTFDRTERNAPTR
jgi:hypothetical protein